MSNRHPDDATKFDPDASGEPLLVPAPVPPPGPGDEPRYELGEAPVTDYARPRGRGGSAGLLPWMLLMLLVAGAAALAWAYYLPLGRELEAARQAGDAAAKARDAALKEKSDLEARVATLEAAQAELAVELSVREQAVAALERARQELQQTQDELQHKLESEIRKGNVLITQIQGQLVVDLVDKILFDSGEAELSDGGKAVLQQVGETLLKVPDKVIQVAGHTDAMPISPKLIDRFPSNWELSSTRATNVVRFLQDEVHVPGERLVAAGYGQHRPVASNNTKSGRRRNRRIEVMLVPVPPKP